MQNLKMYANLHTHSTHSDGAYDPRKLVSIAAREGYRAFAVTDHDTATACPHVKAECEKHGMEYLFGVEFSSPCRELGTGFHITGYLFDPTYEPMRLYLEERSACEAHQTKELFDRGVREGLLTDISWEEVCEYNKGITWLCNEHVFRTLKAKGLKQDTDYPDFFQTVYGKRRGEVKPLYPFLQADQIIRLINDAGGIAIVAHPANQLQYVEALTKMGIAGIEVWHPDVRLQSPTEELEALRMAQRYDLFVSGGSDHSGLCGGQYERYEHPEETEFYFPPCTLGTTEEFFREIMLGKKASDRADVLAHYIELQRQISEQ